MKKVVIFVLLFLMILPENLNILNKISTGMNNKTITIQLSNLE